MSWRSESPFTVGFRAYVGFWFHCSPNPIDDNVFYRDSVMLAQKLIELRKDKWELAGYPMERHGFVHSDSWYDEYRRIFELFEEALK